MAQVGTIFLCQERGLGPGVAAWQEVGPDQMFPGCLPPAALPRAHPWLPVLCSLSSGFEGEARLRPCVQCIVS